MRAPAFFRCWQNIFCLALLLASFCAAQARAEGLRTEAVRIPITANEAGGVIIELEAMVIRPDDGLAHPLAMLNHGSPRLAKDIPRMTPNGLWAPAVAFARRGWVAVVVMRRGYGTSQGAWAEGHHSCEKPDYVHAGDVGAYDIAAAADYMRRQPYVSKEKWISVGASAGGFATIALTAQPPPTLAAAIAFAPGRGSTAADVVCGEQLLIAAFAHYGETSRVPLLWMAAENDHFFGPQLVKRMTEAFTKAGGNVTFAELPAFGKDGHQLFTAAKGIPIWTPVVDQFLTANKLTLRDTLIDVPRPQVAPPADLSAKGREAFDNYLDGAPNKAFATSSTRFGWATGRRTIEDARKAALDFCAGTGQMNGQEGGQTKCAIVNVNNDPAE